MQAERRINGLKGSLDDKEREVIASAQKLQEVLSASAASEKTITQLEEAMQRLTHMLIQCPSLLLLLYAHTVPISTAPPISRCINHRGLYLMFWCEISLNMN